MMWLLNYTDDGEHFNANQVLYVSLTNVCQEKTECRINIQAVYYVFCGSLAKKCLSKS